MTELETYICWYIHTNGLDDMPDDQIISGFHDFCQEKFGKVFVDNAYPQYLNFLKNNSKNA